MMSLLGDFGVAAGVTIHTDASAAIGIVRREQDSANSGT